MPALDLVHRLQRAGEAGAAAAGDPHDRLVPGAERVDEPLLGLVDRAEHAPGRSRRRPSRCRPSSSSASASASTTASRASPAWLTSRRRRAWSVCPVPTIATDGHARSSVTTQWFCIPSPPVPWARPRLADPSADGLRPASSLDHLVQPDQPGGHHRVGRQRASRRVQAGRVVRPCSTSRPRPRWARPSASTTISSPTVDPADTSTTSNARPRPDRPSDRRPGPPPPPPGVSRAHVPRGSAGRSPTPMPVTHTDSRPIWRATCSVLITTATAPSTGAGQVAKRQRRGDLLVPGG